MVEWNNIFQNQYALKNNKKFKNCKYIVANKMTIIAILLLCYYAIGQ